MATAKLITKKAKEGNFTTLYLRFRNGRAIDITTPTELKVFPEYWNNTSQSFKQRIPYTKNFTEKDKFEMLDQFADLKNLVLKRFNNLHGTGVTKKWLEDIVYEFHHGKEQGKVTMKDYIKKYIEDAKTGERKTARDKMRYTKATVTNLQAFYNVFDKYCDKKGVIDFEGVTVDFYNKFVNYMIDQGLAVNTIGKHIKTLKMIMNSAAGEGLHNNSQHRLSAFKTISGDSYSIRLTGEELSKLYNADLSDQPHWQKARDAFLVLCETALRVSDYRKVDTSIKEDADGFKYVTLKQEKTGGDVVIPVSAGLEMILNKYHGTLPRMPEQKINEYIKKVAKRVGMDEPERWIEEKKGFKVEKTEPRWKLVTCHTGRRTACTNMYLAGIPTIAIMKISGHKTEKAFMKYIKVSSQENAKALYNHEYFRENRYLKVAK